MKCLLLDLKKNTTMYLSEINICLKNNTPYNSIVRSIFLTYPTFVFTGKENIQFFILNKISEFFKIPIMNIQVVGSSKTGHSLPNNTIFDSISSDLDIAIIDVLLFQKYTDCVFLKTEGFTDLTSFKRDHQGEADYKLYLKCISKGIFRPDLMPNCPEKIEWFYFFKQLSIEYKNLFKSINAGIYFSQTTFEFKQVSSIIKYKENNRI